jgi:uncharacterized integral membrane protein
MDSPYQRRRPAILRNFWIYRRLVALAMFLGVLLWFMWINGAPVTVVFPFGLGSFSSSLGWVLLISALFGSLVTALIMTAFRALRFFREPSYAKPEAPPSELPDDRPPPDYAAKTGEGFPDVR